MNSRSFWARARPALLLGFVMAFSSSAGQTFFIALFSGEVRQALHLTHGSFGTLYSAATVASALTLPTVGKAADRFRVAPLASAMLFGLALAALGFSFSEGVIALGLSVFGLRLFGQGMMSHIMFTAFGRWFDSNRGRALSVASLGFPAGSAALPFSVATALLFFDWRALWQLTAGVYLFVLVPLVFLLGQRVQAIETAAAHPDRQPENSRGSWTRVQVLSDPRWYAVMAGVLMPPFIITGFFFHQIHLIETKGWSLTAFAASYPLFAGSSVVVSLAAGPLVDRFGATRLLPFYLLPLAVGLVAIATTESGFVASVFMVLFGGTSGAATIILGALWPELYGTAHLGSIRSVVMSAIVTSTALSPGVMGALLDAGVSLESQGLALAGVTLGCSGLNAMLQPGLNRAKDH